MSQHWENLCLQQQQQIALMDKKILQIKFSFPIPLNAKFSVLPGRGLMRFSQYGNSKLKPVCLDMPSPDMQSLFRQMGRRKS